MCIKRRTDVKNLREDRKQEKTESCFFLLANFIFFFSLVLLFFISSILSALSLKAKEKCTLHKITRISNAATNAKLQY